jgi:hypothetical protein
MFGELHVDPPQLVTAGRELRGVGQRLEELRAYAERVPAASARGGAAPTAVPALLESWAGYARALRELHKVIVCAGLLTAAAAAEYAETEDEVVRRMGGVQP